MSSFVGARPCASLKARSHALSSFRNSPYSAVDMFARRTRGQESDAPVPAGSFRSRLLLSISWILLFLISPRLSSTPLDGTRDGVPSAATRILPPSTLGGARPTTAQLVVLGTGPDGSSRPKCRPRRPHPSDTSHSSPSSRPLPRRGSASVIRATSSSDVPRRHPRHAMVKPRQ